ncbi:uncharacterized protein LOC123263218 [Cotesia glomerata]|uniref:Uncharacterized protein n=1 Tax=Cotesia glomerata TaxID=32391 RepID=A0AAV7IK72_COTGL|nr:uncharacterized protein LOC123263218 [Cotesia glomerata]KAH0554234.1 hypothetical protein KQX54_008675 [Cotesia glomerata]
MTFKSLFNWGGSGGHFKGPYVPLERWQSGWEHPPHSHGHSHGHHGGGGKGGSGAALSALALLAFLFFINCMQQSLNDNTTATVSTTTTALLVRDDDDFISSGVERNPAKLVKTKQLPLTPRNKRSKFEKGDMGSHPDQYS